MMTTPVRTAILGTHDWASREALKAGLRHDLKATTGPFHITSSNAYAFNIPQIFEALKNGLQAPALDTPIDVLAEVLSEEGMQGQAARIHVHASYALELPFDPAVNAQVALERIQTKLPKEVTIDDLRLHGLYKKVKVTPEPLEFKPSSVTVVKGAETHQFDGEGLAVTVCEQAGSLKNLVPLDWQAEIGRLLDAWEQNPGLKIGACNVSPKDVYCFEDAVRNEYGKRERSQPVEALRYCYEFDACPYSDTTVLRRLIAEDPKRSAIGFRAFGSIELRRPEGKPELDAEQTFRLAGLGLDALYYRSQHAKRREQARALISLPSREEDWATLRSLADTEGWTCSFFQNMDSGNKPQW